jgi:hypothetical protein
MEVMWKIIKDKNMKNYNSTTEGTWVEMVPVQLTQEEKDLLRSTKKEDRESQKELRDKIKSEREKKASVKKSKELIAFYNSVKPELKEGDVYQLISIDVSENSKGVLNCRINGEHKQIRF